ncbi:LysR family transcriptional regulator [Prescottella equi]|uniref:LysR family transcriptional regulator n=1 Tax=Rhodococcus hoagii TaxID=43767 RepID=A0A9Q2SWF0_RHOHA|nr:LysR family transcriptional regulator [Prescottella equi]MBM4489174.1 LysR family transcriptional regulator [Prescottella equi]MBM4498274.1 LysR family transcriptional regulator [Prescottella equi]MBM4498339.1 LysR family transcriptional regulator [Prescottella equi]MBM4507131.1 LysR family transcriptional regulator [Prescottella equi]MBM4527135.1 LysR family transcriptional regulator [Prescottella equi]
MTPAQLRAYSAVVRLGSVRAAARELGMTDSGVSMHIAQLRKELDDPLYCRRPSGLAFTPGGLRLASRAVEILGLQQQTALEVSQAGNGRRLLRIAASPLFAEHAAPGLIDLFAGRAKDLSVELSVHPVRQFANLISSRAVDVALGPRVLGERQPLCLHPFLQYEVLTVCAPQHPMARTRPSLRQLREQQWFLGPSAAGGDGVMRHMLRALDIPHERQRIFQSDAAAVEAVRRSSALTLALGFAIDDELSAGSLDLVEGPELRAAGEWCATTLHHQHLQPAATELLHFVSTPRCIQAMIRGTGVDVTHFKPKVHVTLWS